MTTTLPRILLLTFEAPDSHAGGQNQLRPLIERYGSNLIWYSIQPPKSDKHLANELNIPYQHGYLLSRPRSRSLRGLREWINFRVWSQYLGWQAAEFARQHKAEMVWAIMESHAIPAAYRAINILNIPLMLSVMDDPVASYKVSGYSDLYLNYIKKIFAKLMMRAAGCGVISQAMKETYQRDYQRDSTILYVGADVERVLAPPILDRTKQVFTISSVGRIYGYLAPEWSVLVEAVRYLNAKYDTHKFRILHIGNLPEHFAEPEIEVTGWLQGDEYTNALKETDLSISIMTFASHAKLISMTSFPTKISSNLESQRPILAFAPAYSSIVSFVNEYQCGITCGDMHVELLASAIEKILFQKNVYEISIKGMKQALEDHSRTKYYANFESLLAQTMSLTI